MLNNIEEYITLLLENGFEEMLEQFDLTPEEVVMYLIEHGLIPVPDEYLWSN